MMMYSDDGTSLPRPRTDESGYFVSAMVGVDTTRLRRTGAVYVTRAPLTAQVLASLSEDALTGTMDDEMKAIVLRREKRLIFGLVMTGRAVENGRVWDWVDKRIVPTMMRG